tara:strand:- start:224 stop:739 length:516 start_codon:yes stop_codon:yes gene_type:complete
MTVVTQNKIDILTGMIAPFGMSSVPTGWLACDGSTVSRTTYADLFTAIGTTWGAGDGSSTFALPDLEGAFLRGTGSHGTSNMADGNDFAGPSVGSFENDQLQQFRMTVTDENGNSVGKDNGSTVSNQFATSGAGGTALLQTREFITYSFGTPRTGDETRPFNAGVKYCIKF